MSRQELAQETQLSPSTVTNLVGELLDMCLVKEYTGRERRQLARNGSVPLHVNPDAAFALGIDLGKAFTRIVLVDFAGKIRLHHKMEALLDKEPRPAIQSVKERVQSLHVLDYPLVGIGVAVHGPVDEASCTVKTVPYYPKWDDAPVQAVFQEIFERDIMVDNDARLAAYATHWWGSAQDITDFIYFKVGTCVGGAVISDGQLHQGHHKVAGEFGHITVEPDGLSCPCGNHGCLELYASAQGIVSYIEDATNAESSDRTHEYYLAALETIAEQAEAGDPTARQAIDRSAHYLAIGVLDVIYGIDPQAIVVNWEPDNAKAFFQERLNYHLRQRAFHHIVDRIDLRIDDLAQNASAIGAATQHLAHVYESPESYHAAV